MWRLTAAAFPARIADVLHWAEGFVASVPQFLGLTSLPFPCPSISAATSRTGR